MEDKSSRIQNSSNRFQNLKTYKRILCVCSAGLLRSPTIAWVLSNPPYNYNTRAAGSSKIYALIEVDEVLIAWADLIVFANSDNESEVLENFDLESTPTINLNLPDSYEFRDPKLITAIQESLTHESIT